MRILRALIAFHLCLGLRRLGDSLHLIAFFVMAITLFPLGLGPELPLLQKIAPGVVWVCALLAAMLSLPTLFADDAADGTLEQWLIQPVAAEWVVLAKAVSHWLLSGLPLVLSAPFLALMLNIREDALLPLLAALVLGTPALSLIGTLAALLTVGLRRGGLVLMIILLPLTVPVLIFGTGASLQGFSHSGNWMLLAAALLIALPLTLIAGRNALHEAV